MESARVALHRCENLCLIIRDNRRAMDLPYGIPECVRVLVEEGDTESCHCALETVRMFRGRDIY